jgi:multidrug efflux pump subunit AcrA (membrane-fusion protein)
MNRTGDAIFKETGYTPTSVNKIYRADRTSNIRYWFYGILLFLVIFLFLPWTQNISASGTVTTLYQSQRPQQINSIIPGRIVKWWVKEGDFVKKGDTILQLADIKDDYLDPNLVERTQEQLTAKKQKITFYNQKIAATESQVLAMKRGLDLKISSLENKLQQLNRKVLSDSAEMIAAEIDHGIALQQLDRAKQMYKDGIIALVEYERRNNQYNKALAVMTEKRQKFQNTIQDLVICRIEINSERQETADKVFKAESEIASARGEVAATDVDVSKNTNQLANYIIRGSQRWLIAPQNGQVIKAKRAGINEIVKDGDMIVEIVPNEINYAAELFVNPMDLVLLQKNQKVRLVFDGFPAIVFSGWPSSSYGTFEGKIIAVETNRSENGKFRILIVPDGTEKVWPATLKIGTGANGFALLNNVSVWYELWRQINGFPPDFYQPTNDQKGDLKKAK